MNVGSKSLLFGVHCVPIHAFYVYQGYKTLYGRPKDWRWYVAFLIHDLGYWGMKKMDDAAGERHVELGAIIMARLFDKRRTIHSNTAEPGDILLNPKTGEMLYSIASRSHDTKYEILGYWGQQCLLHSRFYAKKIGKKPSKLCFADKMAIVIEPWYSYLPRARASGELWEYVYARLESSKYDNEPETGRFATPFKTVWEMTNLTKTQKLQYWYWKLQDYVKTWVKTHWDGTEDTWTGA